MAAGVRRRGRSVRIASGAVWAVHWLLLLSGLAMAQEASPELTELDAAGLRAELEARRGKTVVLNMWATWCGPCLEEFPHLVAFAREINPEQVAVMAVSSDDPRDLESQVLPFLAEQSPPFPVFLQADSDDRFFPAVDPEWTGAFPHTVIYGPDGQVRGRLGVFHSPAEIHEAVREAISPQPE